MNGPSPPGAIQTFSVFRTKGRAAIRSINAESLQDTVTKFSPFAGNYNLRALPANLIHILTAYRKVCRVYRKILLPATLNRLFRKERFRMFQRIRGGSLILQADTILQSILLCRCSRRKQDKRLKEVQSLFTIRNYKLKIKETSRCPLGSDE